MVVAVTPTSSMPLKGRRSVLTRRYKHLEADRSSWRTHWMELSDYLLPRRGRYLLESGNQAGRKRSNKIIDSTGTQALRTMSAGMQSGMTNPSRPWFRFATPDPDLMKFHTVKLWLADSENVCRSILQKSNFYNTVHSLYTELGGFGTSPLYRQKNFDTVIRFRNFTAGEYVIAENHLGQVDTLGRNFQMTVSSVVEKFVYDPDTGKSNWDGASAATKRLWDNKHYDSLVPVIHMIEPRRKSERNLEKADGLNKAFRSVYFEGGGDHDTVLQEKGYDKFPAYVPRWDVLPGDVYGRSPGMDALGDVKQLQHEQKRKAQAIDKMVDPPMVAPTSLRGKPASVLPGGTTYVDPLQGSQGFQPAYLVQPRIQEMMMDIQEVQERIQRAFYADLFAMMINSDRRQMTATEVAERHEEKLVLLGPALQRVNIELLDPLLEDVFSFALEAGLLPPPPPELAGVELKIEYISLLAQAQQAVSASGIERVLSFTGNLAAVFPDVVDLIDADVAVREYSDILGNTPYILRDEVAVQEMRQAKAQKQQQMEQVAMAQQGAQAAKTLSEADTQNPNALTSLLGAGQTVQ